MTILCLYRVYILVGKVPNNRATVVQRCKITCHTSSNSLMVAQHSHLSMRIILRPQEFVHHSFEYTQRCTMLVLTIVRPSAIERVAHGRLWNSNMLKNQTRPQASGKSHATEATSWSNKVSIAAPKFATSTLMTAPLKVVTIECIEHDVTCLNERVFIITMNHLLTNCSQSTLLAMICRLSLLVLNTS